MSMLDVAKNPNSGPHMLLVAAFEHFDHVLANQALSLIELEDPLAYSRILCAARLSKMMKLTASWSSVHEEAARYVLRAMKNSEWYHGTVERLERQMLDGRPCWLVMHEAFDHLSDVADSDMEELSMLKMLIENISRVLKAAPPVEAPKADWDW